jgi:hypothetical protein
VLDLLRKDVLPAGSKTSCMQERQRSCFPTHAAMGLRHGWGTHCRSWICGGKRGACCEDNVEALIRIGTGHLWSTK